MMEPTGILTIRLSIEDLRVLGRIIHCFSGWCMHYVTKMAVGENRMKIIIRLKTEKTVVLSLTFLSVVSYSNFHNEKIRVPKA